MSDPLLALKPETFELHAGEGFSLGTKNGQLELKLAEVNRLGTALREGGAFSLTFTSAPGPFLPQAIYPLTHPVLGTLEVFLVPLGPKDGVNQYEVIFT